MSGFFSIIADPEMPRRSRAFLLVIALSVIGARPLLAQSRTADSAAILEIIRSRAEAIRTLNAERQAANYAPRAIWLNAFGVRRVGKDSILSYLRGLYADPGFRESRSVREEPPEVIFVRPDVAVVHDFREREGQRLADGTVIARRTHTTFVLAKDRGQWLIQYQHIADERPRPPR